MYQDVGNYVCYGMICRIVWAVSVGAKETDVRFVIAVLFLCTVQCMVFGRWNFQTVG
jgi:hypothetical protein